MLFRSWDLKEGDKKELKEILGKNVYKRDPKLDINQGGIVAIDFGTKKYSCSLSKR